MPTHRTAHARRIDLYLSEADADRLDLIKADRGDDRDIDALRGLIREEAKRIARRTAKAEKENDR